MKTNRQQALPRPVDLVYLAGSDSCERAQEGHCITCGDIATVAKVLAADAGEQLATVEIEGVLSEVDISLVDGVASGQWLLVHGGVALERLLPET